MDFIDYTRIVLNDGRYQLRTVSSIPSWTGQEGDAVFYAAGNVRRMYAYLKDQWNYFGFLNTEGTIIVDGTIEIGTYLKANATDGLWLGHETWASGPFRVDIDGNLVATSATISGSITASSGTIGGWTISAGLLSTGSGGTAVGMAPATYPFYAGNTTAASAPFRVDNTGALTATSATITGSISATSGTIGGFTIGATTITSTNLLIDSGNDKIETTNYVSGALGAGWSINNTIAEFNNIRARGIFKTAVFEKDVISSVGGNLLVADSDILNADMTALDTSTLTIVGNTTFAVNDILRIKDGVDDEWFLVTNIGSAPTYTVTRDRGTDYSANDNPIWKKGTAVVNYGASGEGLIYMTASDTNAPHIDVVTHAGSPWDTTTTRIRIGNVNGFLGASSDLYGIYIGEATKYLKYDPTNGLQIQGIVNITGGNWSHASDATKIDGGDIYTGSVTADKITAGTYVGGNFVVGTGGVIQSSDYVADTTGFKLAPTTGLEINTGTIKGDAFEEAVRDRTYFGSVFLSLKGDGTEGAILITSDTNVSAIDDASRPGVIQATTFSVGTDGGFASVADNGSSKARFTCDAVHGLTTADEINITGTTNYNTTDEAVTVINTTTFDTDQAYAAEDVSANVWTNTPTLTVDTGFLHLGCTGLCIIRGTIDADAQGGLGGATHYSGKPGGAGDNSMFTGQDISTLDGNTACISGSLCGAGGGGGTGNTPGGAMGQGGSGGGAGGIGGIANATKAAGTNAIATDTTYIMALAKGAGDDSTHAYSAQLCRAATFVGAGGGVGSLGYDAGNGGGCVYIECDDLDFDGTITADGENADATSGDNGGGGGGGGGLVVIRTKTSTVDTGTITVIGGIGGSGCAGPCAGGDGAAGFKDVLTIA